MSGSDKSGKEPDTEEKSHLTEREARQASELKEAKKAYEQAMRMRLPRKPPSVRKGR